MSWDGEDYQARFDALAATGQDMHGEARFVLTYEPASVLDAGCGTGRVAIELARRGVEVVGVDLDDSMLDSARRRAPELTWITHDLTTLDLNRVFDLVVLAGNVPLFTPPGTAPALASGCARHVGPGGRIVSGFQLGRGVHLAEWDEWIGLPLVERFSTWDRAPFTPDSDYAVSVYRSVT